MKTISKIVTSLMVLLITTTQAQTTTKSSSKSSTTSSTHSDSGNSRYSYSHSNDKDNNSNVSVSISNSKDTYKLRAKFPVEKYNEVKTILLKELNQKNYQAKSSETHRWTSSTNKDRVYDVTLSGTKLSIDLDKDVASEALVEKFETLGLTLRTVIVGKQNEARRDAERLQREADRLRRDAERMQREADRLQREAKRQATASSRQYKDDAIKIADEARRLAEEARDLNTSAGHKGAVSHEVKKLLKDSKTAYNQNKKNEFSWAWQATQSALISAFINDDLIETEDSIVYINDATGMYVNGKQLTKNKISKYNKILTKHAIPYSCYFTFYKTNRHIVIVNSNVDLDRLVKDAISNNIIDSESKKVKLELNGSTAYKNGNEVSSTTLKKLNIMLLKHNIIPAPGKIFEIMKSGNYKLGYSLDSNSHLGTWQM